MKNGLGKGLDAFWSEETANAEVTQISVYDIDRNEAQPRRNFDGDEIDALAESIRQHGVIQPLVLVKRADRYMIVAGERRWRAAMKAGVKTVPAVVRDYDERQIAEVALIENIQRSDLNDIEKAQAMRALMERYSLTQEEIASRLSMSRPAAANLLRLLSLPESIRTLVADGKLSGGHARALVSVGDEKKQLELANRIISEGLNVRQSEALAAAAAKPKVRPRRIIPEMPELRDFEEVLREKMHTRVRVDGNYERGKIVIDYFSRDELESLYELLAGERK